jgi:hypothetical protein
MRDAVTNPIFIVGAPRSGTGILYRTMAYHPDLAWISNITKKFPSSLLLTRIIMLFRNDHRPTEANNVWQKFTGKADESLGRDDVTPAARRFFHKIVRINLRLFNKPRFLNKCPGNSVRIEFLREVFPDARFIHLLRDGRAAAYSIMRSRLKHSGSYWSVRPPGWQALLQRPLLDACTLQWKMVVEHVIQSAKSLPDDQYMEVRYEDFVTRPSDVLRSVGARYNLDWQDKLLQAITKNIDNRNFKWQDNLSDEEKRKVDFLLGDFLMQLGYEA